MSVERHPWVRVASFGVGWEADLAVARLDAEAVPARTVGNDLVGIFGPGFQGASARGFFVEVPAPFVSKARVVLARPVAEATEGEDWARHRDSRLLDEAGASDTNDLGGPADDGDG